MDLCARRPTVRRFGAAGGDLPLLADRTGEHPCRHLKAYASILQADAYAGFNDLYHPARKPGPILEAGWRAHGRRKPFVLADVAKAPLTIEAVRRIDAVFDVERDINGLPATQRQALRPIRAAPLVTSLATWMPSERGKLSRHADVAKAMDYMLKRGDVFTRFLDDGRICLANNAAARSLRGIALGRESWLFAGSDRRGKRAAAMYSLIVTAKLNDIDPRAWLADVLACISDHPASRLHELVPWHWARAKSGLLSQPDDGGTESRLHHLRVANLLGEPEELLHDIAIEMEPEDGCLSILGLGDVSTVAFTSQGVGNLRELLADRKN